MGAIQERINEILKELPEETTPQERAKALRDIMQATTLEVPFGLAERINSNKLKLLLQQSAEDIEKSTRKPQHA